MNIIMIYHTCSSSSFVMFLCRVVLEFISIGACSGLIDHPSTRNGNVFESIHNQLFKEYLD